MVVDDVGGWFEAGLDLLVRVCRDDVKFISGEEQELSIFGRQLDSGCVTQHQQTAIEWHTTIGSLSESE